MKNIECIVNGKPRMFAVRTIDYARLCRVAGAREEATPTIVWSCRRTGRDGSLTPGKTLTLVPGMVISVMVTAAA